MYCNFFGLRSHPFEDRADAQFFYPTAECQEALAAMDYEIQNGTGLGLLIGKAGTGKTILIRALLQRLQNSDQTVVVTWPPSGAMDLIRECCKGFGVTLPSSHHETRRVSRLRRHLGRSAGAGHRSILILDQAENLSPSNIAELATLADLSGDRGKLLTILLAAQPHVRSLLDRPEFARIRQQLFGERTLSPLTETDTRKYVRHRLRIAGAGDADLFDARAIALIHEISSGIPRLINRICNAAMLTAYGAETPCITRAIVEEATTTTPTVRERSASARELGLATAGDGGAPWLNIPKTAEPDDPRMAGDWFESSIAAAGIIDNEESDDAWSAVDRISGASIADAAYEGSDGGSPQSGPSSGTVLLARLERATARAERMTITTEASLTRLAAVEKHVASLNEQAERLAGSLARFRAADLSYTERTDPAAVNELDARGQTVTRLLVDAVQRGELLLREVQATGERVTALQQQVAHSLVDIGIGCERVAGARAQAGEFEQLAAAREGCRAATKQLEAVVVSAGQIHDALQGLVAHADEKIDRLGSHHAAASHILDRLSAANVAGHKVVERIEKSGHVAEDSAAKTLSRIERLTAPTAVMENVRNQATQLESVYAAVRKIFANLSEATLKAQRQTEELKGAGADTAARLAELTAETDLATRTLHEWVEEAVRTQSRLEQTLGECPSIRQTHPTEAVHRLFRSADPLGRIVREGVGGQLQVLSQPGAASIEPKVAKLPTRAEEIARLIAEAKQTEAGAPA